MKINFKNQRAKEIYPYIKGKSVLDIGCYAEIKELIKNKEKEQDDGWIHGFLTKHSKHVTGIDIVKDKIDIMKKQGYDVYCQNAENFKFNQKFDVIFAGDVIEHLSNPGLFLDRCRKHIKKDGWLIITTPNVFSLNYKIGGIIRLLNNDLEVHPEHTYFFSPTVIKTLFQRYDFEIKKIKFVNFNYIDNLKKFIQEIFCRILGDRLRHNMVIFAKLKKISFNFI